MIDTTKVTWRMRLRVKRDFGPSFLTHGPTEINLTNTLESILRYVKDEYLNNTGRVALSFSRNDEEFYTLTPHWFETVESFTEKCRERITEFCGRHGIPLQTGV